MPGADESLSVSVLAFREGEVWVAQCIEYDISTLQKDFVDAARSFTPRIIRYSCR
jgi:hypothetical protein